LGVADRSILRHRRYGVEKFAKAAAKAGVDGVLETAHPAKFPAEIERTATDAR